MTDQTADVPAYRPVPTTQDRMRAANTAALALDPSGRYNEAIGAADRIPVRAGCGHTPEQHRHTDGQDADAASRDRAIRELTAERDGLRDDIQRVEQTRQEQVAELHRRLDQARAERDERLTLAESSRLAKRVDAAEEAATFRQGVIDQYRDELGAAGEVIAVVRDAQEQIDRALARYDTAPEVTPVEPDEPEAADLEDALEHAESALIDRDDSVWRSGDGGLWTTRYLEPMTRDDIEQVYGPTRAVLLIDIDQDDEPETEAEAPLGSVSPHAQDDIRERMAALAAMEEHIGESCENAAHNIRSVLDGTYDPRPDADKHELTYRRASWLTPTDPEGAEQVLRDRLEHAIRARLTVAWPALDDEVFPDQVAAVAAVAAVNELRQG